MASKNFSIGATEAMHIAISVITIALAFTLFPAGSFTIEIFLVILLTVGLGFVLHELGHKFVAVKYGAHAEYRAWTWGLFLALGLAFITNGGFIFAAPGAVYVLGKHLTREQNGRIALAGAFTNLILAGLFLLLGLAFPNLEPLAGIGVYVNAFLGAFNLLPFGPLDGKTVFQWNKIAWALTFFALAAVWFFNPFPVQF
ncbi:MAG: site-2 protease family protein [Candidatus Micrarchaeota archaeon]